MPPIIFVLLNGLFLLLLYVFVARAVRAVVRDVLRASPASQAAPVPPPAAARQPARAAPKATPSPAPRKRRAAPTELVVHPPEGRPRVVPLEGEIRFGRSSGSTVVLSDTFASDQHARIYRDGGGDWVVVDVGSTNGTYLNKAKVTQPSPLTPGDQVSMGKTVVEVRR